MASSPDVRRVWSPRWACCACCSRRSAGAAQLLIRGLLALWTFGTSLWNRIEFRQGDGGGLDTAYLTYWGVWLTVFYTATAFACSLVAFFRPDVGACADPRSAPLPPRMRTAWVALVSSSTILFSIATAVELVVVFIYWVLLAEPHYTILSTWNNAENHGVRFATMWLDMLLSAQRLPDVHVAPLVLLAILYLCTNATISILVGQVYSIIDWRKSSGAVPIIGVTAFVFASFYIAALVVSLRDVLAARVRSSEALSEGAYPNVFSDDPSPLPCGCCRRRRACCGCAKLESADLGNDAAKAAETGVS